MKSKWVYLLEVEVNEIDVPVKLNVIAKNYQHAEKMAEEWMANQNCTIKLVRILESIVAFEEVES